MAPWERFATGLPRPAKPRRLDPIRLVCFDLDGVLLDQESSWVTVHRHFKLDNDASLRAFLLGRITEEEFIQRDVALWRAKRPGITRRDVGRILLKHMSFARGAKATVQTLQRRGATCAIVSSGIDLAAQAAGRVLGIGLVSANELLADAAGRLTGQGLVHTPLRDKSAPLRRFASDLGVPLGQVAAVGNSAPDVAMLRACGVGIAFRPADEFVRGAADAVVPGTTLGEILPVIYPG